MAFGDIAEVVEAAVTSGLIVTATYASATPAADDLNIALHFTGAPTSNVDTAGFTEDQLLTNATEDDEGAIYSQLVTGAGDDTVTCSGNGVDNEHMLLFILVRGAFAATPKDLSDSSGRVTTSPAATGASGGSIAQADEFKIAIECLRTPTDQTSAWVRQGTATPTSDMTELTGGGIATTFKRIEGASQLLTAIGTVGVSRTFTSNPTMIGYVTYKKAVDPAIVGDAAGSTVAAGVLIGRGFMVADAAGNTVAAGALIGRVQLVGSAVGSTIAAGVLVGVGQSVGDAAGSTIAAGIIIGRGQMVASVEGTSGGTTTLAGVLTRVAVEFGQAVVFDVGLQKVFVQDVGKL